MSRRTVLLLVVLGAALAGFAFASAVGSVSEDDEPVEPGVAASPQRVKLDWRETHGPAGSQLVFEVDELVVAEDGWSADVALTNETPVPYAIGGGQAGLGREFGLMLFETGELTELARRNEDRSLPAIRRATAYEPALPAILQPRDSWRGTISAPGALLAGSWVRVVFGALVAAEEGSEQLDRSVVWITDHAYRLRA